MSGLGGARCYRVAALGIEAAARSRGWVCPSKAAGSRPGLIRILFSFSSLTQGKWTHR